jgi:tripartite-type tricarboxylate transporter receptor subunit TctC
MHKANVNRRTAMAGAAAAVAAPGLVLAQSPDVFPNKVISIIVPFGPGGGTDVVGRFIAQHMGEVLPQKAIVVNKPGAAGMLGTQTIKSSPADGYTLMFTSQSVVSQTYESQGKASHRDLVFLGMLNQDALGIAVEQKAKWRTLKEFIDDAKKDPGGLSVGTSGVGSVTHMEVLLLEKAAGIKLNAIPYPGSTGTQTALLSGTVNAAAVVVGDGAALLKDGRMRLLGIMSGSRMEAFPDVPTLRESGINVDFIFWRGLFAHKDTPAPVVATLRQAVARVARSPAFKAQMVQGNFIPAAMVDEAELEAFIRKEETIVEDVRKAIGAK